MIATSLLLLAPATLALVGGSSVDRNSLCRAGDVDCDGVQDIAFATGRSRHAVRIFSGATGGLLRTYEGDRRRDRFGRAMANVGDVDVDGVDDLAVATAPASAGYVDVISGRSGDRIYRLDAGAGGGHFGDSLAGGSDLDGDLVPDIAVSGNRYHAGIVWTFSGRTGRMLRVHVARPDGIGVFQPSEIRPYKAFIEGSSNAAPADAELLTTVDLGRGLLIGPDVDGDGLGELFATLDPLHRANSRLDPGEVAERFGGVDHPFDILDGHEAVAVFAASTGSILRLIEHDPRHERDPFGFGWTLNSPGDIDRDGTRDIVISCVHSALHAYAPVQGGQIWSRRIHASGAMHAEGSTAGVLSDVDGDGLDDLCVGANEPWDTDRGYARIVSGATGAVLAEWTPQSRKEGVDVCPLGDLDGDGFIDLAVATRYEPRIDLRSGRDLSLLLTIDRDRTD